MKRLYNIIFKLLFLVFVLVLFICVNDVYAEDYSINEYTMNVIIKDNGDLFVEEQMVYEFSNEMNGLVREFLYNYKYENQKDDINPTSSRYQASDIEGLRVYISDTGFTDMKEAVLVSNAENGDNGVYTKDSINNKGESKYIIKVYSPIKTKYKYVEYAYNIKNVAVLYNDKAEMYYNFIGGNWTCEIDKFNINIDFENDIDINDVDIYPHTYVKNYEKVNQDYLLSYNVYNINPGEAFDARIVFPKEALSSCEKVYYENYPNDEIQQMEDSMSRDRDKYFISVNIYYILVITLIIITILFIIISKIKASPRKLKEKNIDYYRDIPNKLELGEYANIINRNLGYLDNNLIVATILDLVNKKVLNMETQKNDQKKIFNNIEYKYYLSVGEKIEDKIKNLNEYEMIIINILFFAKDSKTIKDLEKIKEKKVELNEAIKKYAKTKKTGFYNYRYKKNQEMTKKTYEKMKTNIIKVFITLCIIVFAAILINFIFISPANIDIKLPQFILTLIFSIIIFGVGIAIICNTLIVLREEYQEEYKNIIGLKKYLEDYSMIKQRYPIEISLWDRYLVYASLFGIADKVSKEIKEELVNQGYSEEDIYTMHPCICMAVYTNSINNSIVSTVGGSSSSGGYSGGGSGGGRPEVVGGGGAF